MNVAFCGSPYPSRGVLQNARRLRRKARLMQLTDYRAFCKTPLLAAVVVLGLQMAQAVFIVFVPNPFLARISQLRFAHSVTIV